jgi:hypothetical protein
MNYDHFEAIRKTLTKVVDETRKFAPETNMHLMGLGSINHLSYVNWEAVAAICIDEKLKLK